MQRRNGDELCSLFHYSFSEDVQYMTKYSAAIVMQAQAAFQEHEEEGSFFL